MFPAAHHSTRSTSLPRSISKSTASNLHTKVSTAPPVAAHLRRRPPPFPKYPLNSPHQSKQNIHPASGANSLPCTLINSFHPPPTSSRVSFGARNSRSPSPAINLIPRLSLFMASALDLLHRRRRWFIIAAAAGSAGYGAYRLYHLPSVTRHRRNLARLADAILSLADAAASSADTLTLISSDLNRFLRSDSDELPPSLTQLSKLAASEEFSVSLSKTSEALTTGFLRGYSSTNPDSTPGFSDRLLEKLVSPAGAGFVSVVVGSFARESVLAFYSAGGRGSELAESEPQWAKLITGDKGKALIGDCVQRFVSTAVAVFLDKTMDINTYDQLFSGLTNPKHRPQMKDILVTVCNGAIETLVKTSHQVMTGSSSGGGEMLVDGKRMSSVAGEEGGGWVDQVSSTLAVPSNRRFVLDVTGRVTFETVRSFLEFLLWKMRDGALRSVSAVRKEVVGRGFEVMRYISAKTMVIVTVCLALCIKMLGGSKVLMPA